MKKLLCVMVAILIMSGCGRINSKENKKEIPDFRGFKTDVYTVINDTKISGSAVYSELDGLVLTLTSPDSVNGMEIICKDGECKVNLQELSFSVLCEHLPFNSMIVSLVACGENAKTSIYENGVYKFIANGYTYQLYVDEETKYFEKIVADGKEILHLENFEYLTGQTDA